LCGVAEEKPLPWLSPKAPERRQQNMVVSYAATLMLLCLSFPFSVHHCIGEWIVPETTWHDFIAYYNFITPSFSWLVVYLPKNSSIFKNKIWSNEYHVRVQHNSYIAVLGIRKETCYLIYNLSFRDSLYTECNVQKCLTLSTIS